jgi:hypothetical protein
MTEFDSLLEELGSDIESLANPLFDASKFLLHKRGNFLPHGAVLKNTGEVELVMAKPQRFCQFCMKG